MSPARAFDEPGHPRRRPPRRVGDLLPEAARALGLEEQLRWARAVAAWDAVVAERVPAAAGGSAPVRSATATGPSSSRPWSRLSDRSCASAPTSSSRRSRPPPVAWPPCDCGWWWAGVSSGGHGPHSQAAPSIGPGAVRRHAGAPPTVL